MNNTQLNNTIECKREAFGSTLVYFSVDVLFKTATKQHHKETTIDNHTAHIRYTVSKFRFCVHGNPAKQR